MVFVFIVLDLFVIVVEVIVEVGVVSDARCVKFTVKLRVVYLRI